MSFRKRLFLLALAGGSLVCSGAGAQEPQPRKKGRFWDAVNKVLTVNGEPLGKSSLTASSNTIKGSWTGLGAGDNYQDYVHSPRNHHYTIDITEDNATVTFVFETPIPYAYVMAVSENGGYITNSLAGTHYVTFPRSGKYHLIFHAGRYQRGPYRLDMTGPVSNVRQQTFETWQKSALSFGDEGGGGGDNNLFSPRNHVFTFEPQLDASYDINVESNGTALQMAVVEPNGHVIPGKNGNSEGVRYVIEKARQRGIYRIYVATAAPGERGQYTLDIAGNLTQKPQQVVPKFQALKGDFSGQPRSYSVRSGQGMMEVLYRSTNMPVQLAVVNPFAQALTPNWYNRPTEQFWNDSYVLDQNGVYKLSLTPQKPGAGNYEILLWGYFDSVTEDPAGKAPSPAAGRQAGTTAAAGRTGSVSTIRETQNSLPAESGELVTLTGRVISRRVTDLRDFRILYEDLENGQRLGEVKPDASGRYELRLPRGKQYSITAVSDENLIASSQHIDLEQTVRTKTRYEIQPITVISPEDAGEKLVLNNIFFDSGSPLLLRKSYAELKRISAFLKANPALRVEIAGHTDNVGVDEKNRVLSQDRAKSVLYYLQDQIGETSEGRLIARGYGRKEPVSSNTTDAGRQLNRRVEFRLLR